MKSFVPLVLLLLVASSISLIRSPGGEPHALISIPHSSPAMHSKVLKQLQYDVVGSDEKSLQIVVSKEELTQFKEYTVLQTSDQGPRGYKNLQQVEATLRNIAAAHPKITKLVSLSADFLGGTRTVRNNTIWALKVSSNPHVELDLPNVLVLATHHARETINAELVLTIIQDMTDNYHKDPLWTKFVDKYQYWIIPVVNPDGYDIVFKSNSMWRKNAPERGGSGVDLNRNYDLGYSSRCGGSTAPSSQTYRGTSEKSEVETKTIVALTKKFAFAKVLDFHSYGRIIFAGYSYCTPGPKSINDYILRMGATLARKASYTPPPIEDTDGMHPGHHYKHSTYYTYLIETYSGSFQPAFETALAEIRRIRPLWVEFFNTSIPLQGHVRDSTSMAPIAGAKYTIKEIDWKNGESRHTDGFGRYSFFAPGGNYTFVFSAPNYSDSTVQVTIPAETSQITKVVNVKLTKQ
jgi:hypothetical protein